MEGNVIELKTIFLDVVLSALHYKQFFVQRHQCITFLLALFAYIDD